MTEARITEVLKKAGALRITRPDWKKNGLRLSAEIAPEKIQEVCSLLLKEGYTLLDLSAAEFQEGFLATYHLDNFQDPFRLALRVLIDREKAEIPSVASVYQGAEWHERESADFFGLKFSGNPNPVPLLLPHDLPLPPPLLKKPEALASLSALNFLGDELYSAPPEKAGDEDRGKGDGKDA
ncbi:MAG: NADH-quinone oxidoreductase subunit C [Deltaproteobacteria bacterium]|jgi:NADH-quinone oxidoreductase subunit C|nr:NADH-quinone oxidoreductase subunit C [Deltaproteobacteria bacterium]